MKREEVVDIFKEGKFELLALTETKLKGKGEVLWSGINVIFTSAHEMERAREGVAILLNNMWHSAVVKSVYVSSIILWIKFKFSIIKVCMVVGYGPTKGDREERDRFWNDMDKTLVCVGSEYRVCILGDLDGWIGNRTRAGITSAFGVPGENDNGRRVVDFCEERGLCG